jgi:hypothetical protein
MPRGLPHVSMMSPTSQFAFRLEALLVACLMCLCGCGKQERLASSVPVPKPSEAASQLLSAFKNAPEEARNGATAVSDALRAADYDKAARTLLTLSGRKDLTPEQYMAVHESEMTLVAKFMERRMQEAQGKPAK